MFRFEGNLGGPPPQNWRYNLGGFYRNHQGMRTAGWTANRGGQIDRAVIISSGETLRVLGIKKLNLQQNHLTNRTPNLGSHSS